MNYEELYNQSVKKLEEVRIRKAKVQEQISTLAKQLGLDETKPFELQLDELEAQFVDRKQTLDEKLKELEAKFKALDGAHDSQSPSN